jgi:hypothetical protein
MALPFTATSRRSDAWVLVGLASGFPNITESGRVALSSWQPCKNIETTAQACKVFVAPGTDGDVGDAVRIPEIPKDAVNSTLKSDDQILVFQYRGKFHAINNVCYAINESVHILQPLMQCRNVPTRRIRSPTAFRLTSRISAFY